MLHFFSPKGEHEHGSKKTHQGLLLPDVATTTVHNTPNITDDLYAALAPVAQYFNLSFQVRW